MAKPQTTVKYFVICPGYHFNGGLADEVEKKQEVAVEGVEVYG